MKIIKHGKLYQEETFICPICKCEYTVYIKECKQTSFRNRYGQMVHETSCYCPECNVKNFKYKKEGGTNDLFR